MHFRPRLSTAALLLGCAILADASPAVAATLVVANKAEATVSLIDLDSGKVVATLPTGRGPHEVGISADGTRALVTNYGQRGAPGSSLTLIDVPRAEVIGTIELGDYRKPHGVVWLADGHHALVTVEDAQALLEVDVDTGRVTAAIDTGQEVSHMLALGDGRAFVANIGSGSVTVIDLDKGERVANVSTGDGAEGVAVAAGGRQVWITNRAADTVTVLDAASLEVLASFESKGFPIRATATAGGEVLVTRASAGDMMVYDTAELGKGRRVAFDLKASGFEGRLFGDRFGDSSVPIGVVVDGEGERAWVAHANADVITEVDVESGAILRLLTAGKEPDGMGYSPRTVAPSDTDTGSSSPDHRQQTPQPIIGSSP
ncbi:MAG: cytochrome D1 domain-containing protein [Thermoanaerobaculia bacterium]